MPKDLSQIAIDYATVKANFFNASPGCPHRDGVGCCTHNSYYKNFASPNVCKIDQCPIMRVTSINCVCKVTGYNKYCNVHGSLP